MLRKDLVVGSSYFSEDEHRTSYRLVLPLLFNWPMVSVAGGVRTEEIRDEHVICHVGVRNIESIGYRMTFAFFVYTYSMLGQT